MLYIVLFLWILSIIWVARISSKQLSKYSRKQISKSFQQKEEVISLPNLNKEYEKLSSVLESYSTTITLLQAELSDLKREQQRENQELNALLMYSAASLMEKYYKSHYNFHSNRHKYSNLSSSQKVIPIMNDKYGTNDWKTLLTSDIRQSRNTILNN
jgi:hypothetical protein